MGTTEMSLSSYVGVSNRIVMDRGLRHEVHPMGTVCEGTLDQCVDALKEVINKSLHRAPRIIASVHFDVRPEDQGDRLSKKWARIKFFQSAEGEQT